jgi:hypothetical protein
MEKEQRKVLTIRPKEAGTPIKLMKKQGRNEICKYCESGVKVKNCNCQWAKYCNTY